MLTINVILSYGDSFATRFNGSVEDATEYYVGQTFNMGAAHDHMVDCVSIEII